VGSQLLQLKTPQLVPLRERPTWTKSERLRDEEREEVLKSNDSPLTQTPSLLMGVAPCWLTITKVLRVEDSSRSPEVQYSWPLQDFRVTACTSLLQAPGCHANTWETEPTKKYDKMTQDSWAGCYRDWEYEWDINTFHSSRRAGNHSCSIPRDASYILVGSALP